MGENISETFAGRVRAARESLGMSQAELAQATSEVLGRTIYASAMARIESGDRSVKLDEAVALSRALEVGLPDLLPSDTELDAKRAALAEARSRLEQAQREVEALEREVRSLESTR